MGERDGKKMQGLTVIENRQPIPSSRLLDAPSYAGRTRSDDRGALVFRPGCRLTREERQDLEARRDALAELVEPATPAERAELVYGLLKIMPAKHAGIAEDARQDAYQEALAGAPLFALVAARRAFYRAETDLSDRYAPTPPELARLARDQATPYRRQLARVAALLVAPEEAPPPPATPERAAKAAAAIAMLTGRRPAEAGEEET